jgi:UDP-N-acetylmuramate: L-alanyl-gamma-D-glutamyl-meso-diaminopimelate ligase
VTQDEIVARIRQAGQRATPVTSCAQGVAALESGMTGDEALILLSSGPLGGLIEAIPQLCDQRWPI